MQIDDWTQDDIQFQLSRLGDGQDQTLGLDSYYVEKDDQSNSCDGGVESVDLHTDTIMLKLDEVGSQRRVALDLEAGGTLIWGSISSTDPHQPFGEEAIMGAALHCATKPRVGAFTTGATTIRPQVNGANW